MGQKRVNIHIPSSLDQIVKVKLEGDWVEVIAGMGKLGPEVLRGYEAGVNKFTSTILKIVRQAIRTGQAPDGEYWEPLSPNYIRSTRKHPIYNLTGTYLRHIGVHSNRSRTWVGLPGNRHYPGKNGITINQIAVILEYGRRGNGDVEPDEELGEGWGRDSATAYMPPRPLWNPAFREAGGYNALYELMLKEIRSAIHRSFPSINVSTQVKWSKKPNFRRR